MVAMHLYKATNTWKDLGEGNTNLYYIRDKEKREVDFIIVEDNKPLCLIECKYSDTNLSPHLKYFQDKLNVPVAVQLVHKSGVSRKIKGDKGDIFIFSADRWLAMLP